MRQEYRKLQLLLGGVEEEPQLKVALSGDL